MSRQLTKGYRNGKYACSKMFDFREFIIKTIKRYYYKFIKMTKIIIKNSNTSKC